MTAVLRLDNLRFAYGPERPVLAGCDLVIDGGERVIDGGERVGLVGSNGSGKTTLLWLLLGLLRSTGGRIELFGKPRTTEADFRPIRGRVGLLFQDADDQLFCPTVAEDVAFGPLNLGRSREEARQIVAQTLASLGLEGYEQRITYKLSGGERRLVSLAAVLAMEPELLLLDEPTAGLNEAATERVTQILLDLPQAICSSRTSGPS